MSRMNSQQATHTRAGGWSVSGQLTGIFAVNVTREAARIAENNGADDAVNVIFWPRTGQNSLRSATTFWAQFYTTHTRKKNNLIGRHTISNNVVEVLVGKCGKEKQSHKLFLFLWAGAFTPAHRNYPQTSIDSGSKLYVRASWWDCETYSSSSNQFEKIKFISDSKCLLRNKDVRKNWSKLLNCMKKNWALSELTVNDKLTSGSSLVLNVQPYRRNVGQHLKKRGGGGEKSNAAI